MAEHLDEVVACRALFATHYHELTQLSDTSAHVANYSVSAREVGDDVVFLHRLVVGPASRSYGVAVARLAGLPQSVLARARALLEMLESGTAPRGEVAPSESLSGPRGKRRARAQLDLFAQPVADPAGEELVRTLRALDINVLTPLDALALLAKLKVRVQGKA